MKSFKERYNEILDDLGGRIRNPLILSFIIVWLYQHWQLFWRIFNGYPNFSIEEKLFIVKLYINTYGFYGMIGFPIIVAFGSLAIYYLIATVSQLIKLIIGERFNALVITVFDKGKKYILKTKYDKLKEENSTLVNNFEKTISDNDNLKSKLRQKESELQDTDAKLREKISEKDIEIGKLFAEMKAISIDRNEANEHIEREKENSNLIRDQVNILLKKEIDLNVELDNIKTQITSFKQSEALYKEMKSVEGESPFGHLSLDEHNVMAIVFNGNKWDIRERGKYKETIRYEKGYFIANNDIKYKISDVKFEETGILSFNKINELSNFIQMKSSSVKLKLSNDHSLAGYENDEIVIYSHSKAF